MSKDTFYFSHDCNARTDEKILALRLKLGWEGYGLFWALIEKLRESSDYTSVRDYNIIAYDLRTDANKIKSLVEDFGLFTFTENGKRFYSESLNRRMNIKEDLSQKRAEAGKKGMQKRWGNKTKPTEKESSHNNVITNTYQTDNNVITTDNNKNKINKSKIYNSSFLEKEAKNIYTSGDENFSKNENSDFVNFEEIPEKEKSSLKNENLQKEKSCAKKEKENLEVISDNSQENDENFDFSEEENNLIETPKGKAKNKRFCKPSLDEIKTYCLERQNHVDAEQFWNYYESNGWKVGKNPMKDWKACIRTWERNGFNNNKNQQNETSTNQHEPKFGRMSANDVAKSVAGWTSG